MPLEWGLPLAAGISAIGGAIGGREEPSYRKSYAQQLWARGMAGAYPELRPLELPGIAPEAAGLISRLMTGELPTGVSRALGGGAERAYGATLAGLADIGAGPATLAGARAGIMGRLGEQKALMGWQGMQAGLGAVPAISQLMMEPQKWGYETQQRKWQDIANLFLQTRGAYAEGYTPPSPGWYGL